MNASNGEPMKRAVMRFVRKGGLWLWLCSVTAMAAQSPKPISFRGLVDSLHTHGLSNVELREIVRTRGVDFELSPEKESELKAAGADADLLGAVRESYHAPANAVETVHAANDAAAPAPVAAAPSGPPASAEPSAPVAPTTANPAPPNAAPSNAAVANTVPKNAPVINSIREVKKLYIERMSNDLDQYIKAELSRQMPGRMLVVLRLEDADAIMRGSASNRDGSVTITDLRGTAELWTGKAGDKGIFLTKIHGGEREIAKRLVGSLRKALE